MLLRLPLIAALASLLALCMPGAADAQESGLAAGQAEMGQAELVRRLNVYFAAEKNESLFFMGIGLAALIGAGVMLSRKRRLLKGAAWPILAVGLIQIGVGSSVYFRTDAQVAALEAQIEADPGAYVHEETARMTTVAYWFDIYKIIEIGLLVAGAVALVAGSLRRRDLARGLGLGLVAQSGLMLVLDFFAEARADVYIEVITRFGTGLGS